MAPRRELGVADAGEVDQRVGMGQQMPDDPLVQEWMDRLDACEGGQRRARDRRLAVVEGDGVGRFEADACGIVPAIERAARPAAVELVQQRDQAGDMVRGRQLRTPRARLERQRREDHVVADRVQLADGAP